MGFGLFGGGGNDLGLQPVVPPITLFAGFVRNEPTTIVLKEKVMSMTGDSFSVKDTRGNVICVVKGKMASMRERKVFVAPDGTELFTLRDKMISIRRTFVGELPDGTDIFTVKKALMGMRSTLTCELTSKNENRALEVRGDLVGFDAEITLKNGGLRVGKVDRKLFNSREAMSDKQTYYVTVAAGVDLALAAALCVCVDELHEDKED